VVICGILRKPILFYAFARTFSTLPKPENGYACNNRNLCWERLSNVKNFYYDSVTYRIKTFTTQSFSAYFPLSVSRIQLGGAGFARFPKSFTA
jgi:hypothetical protein